MLVTKLLQHRFNGLFSRTAWVSRYQKGKTSLDLNEARDDGVLGCSGISRTICKQSAPHSRQKTTSTHHHSMFTGQMLVLTPNQQCQSTVGTILDYRAMRMVNIVVHGCRVRCSVEISRAPHLQPLSLPLKPANVTQAVSEALETAKRQSISISPLAGHFPGKPWIINQFFSNQGSRVVSVLGPGFKSQPRCCPVTVLGKLFTSIVPLFTKQRNW